MDTLPKRLAWLRETAGLSARGLGILAGLHPTHIGLIERGDRVDPSSSAMSQVAEVVGATLDWLIAGKGAPPTSGDVLAAVARARLAAQPVDEPRPSHPAAA